jgi:hypothetical protein
MLPYFYLSLYDYFFNYSVNINMNFEMLLERMELLEEAKCTKVTKKAHSNRKGKKWTKCARQSDGSIKRIHWGQAGVRVGSGNSKRAKSFRKRHGCAKAKAGSPKKQACSDWR